MSLQGTTEDPSLPLADQVRNDAVCDRFEVAWRGGEHPDLLGFLSGIVGPARAVLFRELLALDLEFRRGAGECPDVEFYRSRFSEFPGIIVATLAQTVVRMGEAHTLTRIRDTNAPARELGSG